MNNPFLTEEHLRFKEQVRAFAEAEIRPVARELDEQEEFSVELTQKMGARGWFGIYVPKEYGGNGKDYRSLVLLVEELARVDSSQAATIAAHNSLGIGPIYQFGTEEQKKKYLPLLCAGKHLWAFGLTESNAGSDSRNTETRAELVNDNWLINGSKVFISNASSEISVGVSLQAVTGITEKGEKELSVILLDRNTPGYQVDRVRGKMMWRASDTGILTFNNCRAPASNLLGERGKGAQVMLQTLDSGRLTIAAIALGLAQGAFEMALSYARKREQFGKPIGKFQAISFKLADMAMHIEAARSLLYQAVWLKDNGLPFGKESAMAKLFCSEVAHKVVDDAVQVHGAWGLVNQYGVERFYRDQRILEIGEGTSEILRLVISRHLGI
jgi:short-chain 2-methylacyl-CoA dehydrogenase